MAEDGLGGFQAESLADFSGSGVADLVRVPRRPAVAIAAAPRVFGHGILRCHQFVERRDQRSAESS